jgi:asparagine synthase (glutamine-hydrolysing)
MCGIAGIVGHVGEANRAALARMNAAMSHRGPDAQGVWESSPDGRGRGVLLGHRRLAILDLSEAGIQPMIDPVTGHVIVFNGEIYNYVELRERLSAGGQRFQSTGDTAVMLRALSVEGRDATASLRGMFAFAFWDTAKRELLLARDPLGIKPLYVARNRDSGGSWSIAFASGLLGKPKLHAGAAASVVWNGFVMGPETAVEGIESLEPGQLKVFDGAGRETHSKYFWTVPPQQEPGLRDEEELARVLEEGLRLHLASDVPLAVFLSGGVDSSVVANLAQRAARAPVHTFTLAFEEQQYNEGPDARRIADAIGTQHQEVVLSEADFVGGLDAALDSLDQPTFDGLNSYYMSHAIRRAGFTVALVGTGGDELFGGYTSFRDLPVLQRWGRPLGWLPSGPVTSVARLAARALQPSRAAVPPQTRWAKLPDMLARRDDLTALYQLSYALFLPDLQARLLADHAVLPDGLTPSMRARLAQETRGHSTLSALSVMEQRVFLGERLLRDNDAASMAASIEQRLPLVDQVLFESVARLDDRVRYEPIRGKRLLRRIGLRGLDPALFERPKSGFVLPFDRWIRLGLGKVMDRTMRDPQAVRAVGLDPETVRRLWVAFQEGAPGIYWSRVWAVYVLIRWCQRQGVFQ